MMTTKRSSLSRNVSEKTRTRHASRNTPGFICQQGLHPPQPLKRPPTTCHSSRRTYPPGGPSVFCFRYLRALRTHREHTHKSCNGPGVYPGSCRTLPGGREGCCSIRSGQRLLPAAWQATRRKYPPLRRAWLQSWRLCGPRWKLFLSLWWTSPCLRCAWVSPTPIVNRE